MPQFVNSLSNLRPIQVNADDTASFEIDMDLIEPSSSIYLYKVSVKAKLYRSSQSHFHNRSGINLNELTGVILCPWITTINWTIYVLLTTCL